MRTSTVLSIIGFCNLFLGSAGLVYGLLVRIVMGTPSLWDNAAFRRVFAGFPFVETFSRDPEYLRFVWWSTTTDFLCYTALLFAGYWLYSRQPWAWSWTLTCCAYLILRSVLKLAVLVVATVDTGPGLAFAASTFAIEIAYPILAIVILTRPVVIEGLRNGVRERAAAPSLRALSERHRRISNLPRE